MHTSCISRLIRAMVLRRDTQYLTMTFTNLLPYHVFPTKYREKFTTNIATISTGTSRKRHSSSVCTKSLIAIYSSLKHYNKRERRVCDQEILPGGILTIHIGSCYYHIPQTLTTYNNRCTLYC